MARRLALKNNVGESLLSSKLQILNGTGDRRPSMALGILTGRVVAADQVLERSARQQLVPRTVYLSERHLADIEVLVGTLARQRPDRKRLNRSAVLRSAVVYMRKLVEADPDKFVLEID